MEPYAGPTIAPTENTACAQCDGPLEPGRRLTCEACQHAAEVAIRELPGRIVYPSDVDRVRQRDR
jgi:hypothetical protein